MGALLAIIFIGFWCWPSSGLASRFFSTSRRTRNGGSSYNLLVEEAKERIQRDDLAKDAKKRASGDRAQALEFYASLHLLSSWGMNYQELCREVAGLHGSIEVAMVLSNDKLAATHLKSGGPAPDEDEFSYMISQIEMIVKATKANEDKFGELGFITIHYKYIDGLFFPLSDHDTLIIGVVQPYDHDSLAGKILTLLARKK